MHDLPHARAALIVEDDYLIAIDIGRILCSQGYRRIQMVGSCREALAHIDAEHFNLVTVDVKLSDGPCDRLVRSLEERKVPFVIVTGYSPDAFPELTKAPWLVKPIDDDALSGILQHQHSA